ncbi:MAG TPA: hypothetical protein VKF40_21610 [Burkholderiales bacterium]|nr:hypothetical protein [Burkholderiales bacterium]
MPPAAPRHLWMKGAVFALLACNTAIYVASGTISETLDSAAWLTLLVLFELETDFGERIGQGWAAVAIRSARFAAAAAVVAAAIGYAREKEWLDAANSGLWIAIVVLLEFQVRYTRAASRHRVGFTAAATVFYAGLGMLVLAWIWQGEWFDAYDALLWLAALVIIEMNVLRIVRREALATGARPG